MSRDVVTTLDRHTPSGDLRQFLDPLNPGVYFDHGSARLYGIDEVLELEAKRRGRRLGDDEFQLVATDGGLIFCRSSICFAIAARWRDLALHRPSQRNDESGRVDLPVDWPTHGKLTFTVSARLGTNIYRRWLHLREQDDKRAHMAGGQGLEVARHTDPSNPVTVVLDDDARLAMMGELAPDNGGSQAGVDEMTAADALPAVAGPSDAMPDEARLVSEEVDEQLSVSEPSDVDDADPVDVDLSGVDPSDVDPATVYPDDIDSGDVDSGDVRAVEHGIDRVDRDDRSATTLPASRQSGDGSSGALKLPGAWTEPGLELTGGETLFVVPERGTADNSDAVTALSTVDPAGLDLRLDKAFQLDVSTSGEHRPTDVMPSLDGLELESDDGDFGEPLSDVDHQMIERGERPASGVAVVEPEIDPNATVRQVAGQGPFDAEDLLQFDSDNNGDTETDTDESADDSVSPAGRDGVGGDLSDDGAVKDSVFAVERPVIPAAGLPRGDSDVARQAEVDGPGVRDSDTGLGSFKRPGISDLRSMRSVRSKSAPFAGGIGGSSSVEGDATLAEIWHRNRVSIVAGVSLIVLLIVALSSLLNGDDDGAEIEAGAEGEITIPERSGSISLPTEDPVESTSTTEPRAPLVIEGLTTVGDGVGSATGAAGSDGSSTGGLDGDSSSNGAGASTEGQDGDVAICHSNYGGCVPVAADVDCVGDGDGPAFLSEPVVVFGEDVYDLDTDDDREACELGQPLATPPVG